MEFAHIYLDIEAMVRNEIERLNLFHKDNYSLLSICIGWNDGEVEVEGFDRYKGVEFILYYDYHLRRGRVQYYDGVIIPFYG